MILSNKGTYDEFAELDPVSGVTSVYSKKNNPDKWEAVKNIHNGFFREVRGITICIYAHMGKMFFKADDLIIELTEGINIIINGEGYKYLDDKNFREDRINTIYNRFSVVQNNESLFSIDYLIADVDPLIAEAEPGTRWWMIDDTGDDFDIFVLIFNLQKDKERKERLSAAWDKGIIIDDDDDDMD